MNENFVQITKDWSVWNGDINKLQVILKHISCKEDKKLWTNFDIIMSHEDNYMNLGTPVKCVRCGETLPEQIRKTLLLGALDVSV